MNPGFFKSLWRLIQTQLESFSGEESTEKAKKLVKDLFSTTFAKSVEYAEEPDKMRMVELLKEKADIVAEKAEENGSIMSATTSKAINILAESLESSGVVDLSTLDDFSSIIFSSNHSSDEYIQILTSPVVNRVLSGGYFSTVDDFISRMETYVIGPLLVAADTPKSTEEYKKSLLVSSCPILVTSIEMALSQGIKDMDEWCHSPNRNVADIELTFYALLNSPKIGLFRQLPKTPASSVLREKFMATLAISLRLAQESAPTTVEEVQKKFFFIPKAGIVMDRWLDKELKNYNQLVIDKMAELVATKNVSNLESMRGLIRACFVSSSPLMLPYEGGVDTVVGNFFESISEGGFRMLPCCMTAETIRKIISQIGGGYFQFDDIDQDKVFLTQVGLKSGSAVKSVAVPAPPTVPRPQASSATDDLIDILLRELLQRLPEHVFLHRPHPVKVQPGVYRFGAREVTFHTKGGALFVYRVGDYVSESDGAEFVAREFGVAVNKLKPAPTAPAGAGPASNVSAPNFEGPSTRFDESVKKTSNIVAGMRRPMDWDNDELMFRIVRRGLKSNDRVWRENWYTFCRTEGTSQDVRAHKKEVLTKFLEQNMAHASRQEWAKDLLYYMRDDDTSFPPLSEGEDEEVRGRLSMPTSSSTSIPIGRTGAAPSAHPNYKTRLCIMFQQGKCTRGSACGFAHGESDLRAGASGNISSTSVTSTAQFYKTRMCNAFLEGRCTRGSACSYAHSEAERVASASGVPRRDMKVTEDLRLAEKRKALMQHGGRSPSPAPASKSQRTTRQTDDSSKPLPYMAPSRRKDGGSRVDENEL